MKKIKIFSLWSLVFSLFTGCTMIPDAGTRVYVFDRVRSIQVGNTPEQVEYILEGPPRSVTILPYGPDLYELWECKIGNFIYAETAKILFQNGRVIAIPKTAQELVEVLNSIGVVPQAEFLRPRDPVR